MAPTVRRTRQQRSSIKSFQGETNTDAIGSWNNGDEATGGASDGDGDYVSAAASESDEDADADVLEGDNGEGDENHTTLKRKGGPILAHNVRSMEKVHSKGLPRAESRLAKSAQIKLVSGPTAKDALPLLSVRDSFNSRLDTTFPSKDTLSELLTTLSTDSLNPIKVLEDRLGEEATNGWDWYYEENVGEQFRARQKTQDLFPSVAEEYFPRKLSRKHTVLLGPANSQTPFEIGRGECFNFGQAWENGANGKKKERSTSLREGWILNVGNKVQCLAWAPYCSGSSQYLAISVPIRDNQRPHNIESESQPATAFRSAPPFKAAIQIWSVPAEGDNKKPKKLDMSIRLHLCQAVCTEMGDVRKIAWCPTPRPDRGGSIERTHLGLLAGVWSDGILRVLDINVKKVANEPEYIRMDVPAFEGKIPSTLCTCLSWLSSSHIAVGTANGYVAIWNIAFPEEIKPGESFVAPQIYVMLHATYILDIAPAYPTRPDLIATIAIDGQVRLSSILGPKYDVADPIRSRMISSCIEYSPLLQTFMTSDETDLFRLFPLRRFVSTGSISKSSSSVSTISSGTFSHPFVLYGNVEGAVTSTNPLRRVLHPKGKHMQQVWFTHEWVGNNHDDSLPGISRFFDGFKSEGAMLIRHKTKDTRMINGVLPVAIFEEGTAITAVAWNPSIECAGWSAAGTGCGLVRIEDLSI